MIKHDEVIDIISEFDEVDLIEYISKDLNLDEDIVCGVFDSILDYLAINAVKQDDDIGVLS